MFCNFTVDGTKMYTNQKLSISSMFYIKVMFTGRYNTGCGLAFNILDTDIMYHLDFRLNNKGDHKKLVQASRWNGEWSYRTPQLTSELPKLEKENDIVVLVTDKYFQVAVNNDMIAQKFPIDMKRLYDYNGVSIELYAEQCIWVDLQKSYMTHGGNISI